MATKKPRRSSVIEPKWLLVFIFFIAGGFTGGLAIYLYSNASHPSTVKFHLAPGQHRYTNPTLASETATADDFSSVNKDLQVKVKGIITRSEADGDVSEAGVYFRDLEPGTWLAQNAGQQFSPGYLLKIPLMITYYKLAEQDPNSLNKKILFTGPSLPQKDLFYSAEPLVVGESYDVETLIENAIVGSDDTSAALLFRNVDKNTLGEIFSDLGIDFTEDDVNLDSISLRRYSLFFRVLYNATYLSTAFSEKALGLLAQNDSRSLLQSNLPESIPFVSRVGGRALTTGAKPGNEIYECDIVYYPGHDYLLCMVARGSSVGSIGALFGLVGSAIYDNMLYQYGK